MAGIDLSPDRRTLLASGFGLLFRKDLAEPIPLPAGSAPEVVNEPAGISLSIMPNPVRDAALLRIAMRKPATVSGTLHIYDALGRSVADLSDKLAHGGNGATIDVELPVDRLRSGTYMVRGVVGGRSVQIMFIVAK